MVDWKAISCELLYNAWKKYTSAPYWGNPEAFAKAKLCVEFASELGCEWALFGGGGSTSGHWPSADPVVPPKPCSYVADPAFGIIVRDPVGFSLGRC